MSRLVSVIIPMFRVEAYVEALVRSLTIQSFQDFQVILVDDASDDASLAVAESALRHGGLDFISLSHEVNRGVSAARNTGIDHVDTPLQVCVDPDDVLAPSFLAELVDGLRGSAPMSMTSFRMMPIGGTVDSSAGSQFRLSGAQAQRDFLLRRRRMIVPATMFRSSFVEEVGLRYATAIKFGEDVEFLWRAILAVDSVQYSSSELYGYVRRPGSTMSSSPVGKVLTGYEGFRILAGEVRDDPAADPWVAEWLLGRWVLGALRSSAMTLDLQDFVALAERMDYRQHCLHLSHFPDVRVRLLASILGRSPRLFHRLA